MTGTMNNGTSGARMAQNAPTRTNQGGNQSKGGNYENPGGNSTGTMGTQMNAGTTGGQPDSSGPSTFMNNGGGPEPHQGGNPGAQSDPGPKEIGFYDQASSHVLGDDGIQATVERPSPMRMGGVSGSTPNPGQRGGQNTGTSGAQTTSNYSSPEEYGAGSDYDGGIPGVTQTRGGNAFAGEQYSGGDRPRSSEAGYGAGRTAGGALGAETRNPVGFAANMPGEAEATHVPGHAGQAGGHAFQGMASEAAREETTMRGPQHGSFAGELDTGGEGHVYQSRAAQKLVDARRDSPTTYTRMDEPAEDASPRAADKAGEVADAVKNKAGGFFSGAKDKVEGFLNVDLDNDGAVGDAGSGAGAEMADRQWDKAGGHEGKPDADGTFGGYKGASPEAFETREKAASGRADPTPQGTGAQGAAPQGAKDTSYRDATSPGSATGGGGGSFDAGLPDMSERTVARNDVKHRELVDA